MRLSLPLLLMLMTLSANAMSIFETDTPTDQARADAESAYQQGDTRLLGLMTRALSVPGVQDDRLQQAIQACGIRKISRSDVLKGREHMQSSREQADYVERYNQNMLKLCLD